MFALNINIFQFGFHQMFDNPASFTRITKGNNGRLVVSDIIQKSGIEIDEEGSVVYSATGNIFLIILLLVFIQ